MCMGFTVRKSKWNSHSLNFHSWRHIGHCCWTCCEFNHFRMQCMWKQCEHWPQTSGQSSPGTLPAYRKNRQIHNTHTGFTLKQTVMVNWYPQKQHHDAVNPLLFKKKNFYVVCPRYDVNSNLERDVWERLPQRLIHCLEPETQFPHCFTNAQIYYMKQICWYLAPFYHY